MAHAISHVIANFDSIYFDGSRILAYADGGIPARSTGTVSGN